MLHTPITDTHVSGPRAAILLYRFSGRVARLAGNVAALTMFFLTFAIVLGIVFRIVGINNTWTYDLDVYMLIWLAFVGAAWTSYLNAHVTAGVALEHMLGRGGKVLGVLRFIVIAGFLVLFVIASYHQMQDSFVTGEETLDVVQWPVWISKAALPIGAVAWIAAELHKLLKTFLSTDPAS